MAQQQARDEAGNIWNIDEAGNPVSLAQAAGAQSGGAVVAPNPVQAQRQSTELVGAGLGNQKTAQQIALEAAKAPSEIQKATLEVEGTRLANEKARRELANPVETKQAQTDRVSRLMQLASQVGRTQYLYNTGIGTTKGLSGIWDYAPTDANARFDVAGNQIAQQGLAAFKVPGMGTVSDRDSVMFDRANLPTAATRDAAVEEQLRSIKNRVNEEMKALGRAPLNWDAITQAQSDDRAGVAGAASGAGSNGGGSGPAGYDVATTSGISGGGGGGSFASAAGVAMAQKMKAVYNRGGGVREINQLLQDNGFQPLTDPSAIAAIQKRGPISFAPPVADDTRGGFGRWIGDIAGSDDWKGDVAAYGINAADALTGNNLDSLAGGQAGLAIDYARQRSPNAALAGTIVGSGVAAAGAELGLGAAAARAGLGASPWVARGADALYGAVSGAGSADGENDSRLLGAAVGGIAGLGGGMAGRASVRGASNLLTGVRNPYVQGLRNAEVPMSVGQAVSQSGVLGAGIKRMEDLTTGIPGVGTVVNAGRTNSMQGFNRAAFNEGLAPIGERTGGVIQEQGIDLAQDATTRGYRSALDNVNVTPEPQFRTEYDAAVATGGAVPRVGPEFAAYEKANMAPLVDQPSFDGNTIQDFIQQTRGADFGSDAMGNLVGKSVTGAENAMRGLVGRQAPDVLPKLSRADQAYRQVQILRDAVNRARGGTMSGETGVFTPSQLADATAANAKKYGGTQGTTRQPFFDLARAGQAVLPSKVGDSGSAGRLLMQSALGTAGVGAVGGGYAAGGSTEGAGYGAGGALALGALLAAGGSKTAQKAAVKLLLDRPDAFIKAGNKIKGRAQIGGIFGAPILAGAAPLLTQ